MWIKNYSLGVLLLLLLVQISICQALEGNSTDEARQLRQLAEKEISKGISEENEAPDTTFRSGGLGLQALNPEISVTGDFLLSGFWGTDIDKKLDFNFRGLGLHFEAYLDPYSRFKAAVPVNASGAELGEAYFTRYGTLGNINLTLGKFRQQFGMVNRWHKHGLDYLDFPLPLRMIFGEGGLNQTGISLDWNRSIGGISQEIVLQLTDGENPRMFEGNTENLPCALVHYKLNRDLSSSTYLELGLTALAGANDEWVVTGPVAVTDSRFLTVYGIDFAALWEPTDRMRYRNIEWRIEFYSVNKNIIAPDGTTGTDTLKPWGSYTSLQVKASRTLDVGTRLDYYRPEVKEYANITNLSLYPLAVTENNSHRSLTSVYATWHQSPFVKYHIEYNYEDGNGMGTPVNSIILQCVFAAGPHKHERY